MKYKQWITDVGTPEYIQSRVMMLQADGYCIEYLAKISESKMISYAFIFKNQKEETGEQSNKLGESSKPTNEITN